MKNVKTLPHQRKRTGKTDYRLRYKLLVSHKPRLVIRKSRKHLLLQIVTYEPQGDKILTSAHTTNLKAYGWTNATRNTPAAYLIGYLLGKKAHTRKINEAILDLGMQKSVRGSILFAAVKGALDAGIHIPHRKEIFPSQERIQGKHLKKTQFEEVFKTIQSKHP